MKQPELKMIACSCQEPGVSGEGRGGTEKTIHVPLISERTREQEQILFFFGNVNIVLNNHKPFFEPLTFAKLEYLLTLLIEYF